MRQRRVMVTGGSGFVGRHVVEELRRRGYQDVVGLSRADADLVDPRSVDRLLGQQRPAALIHLAAAVGGIGVHRSQAGRFSYANTMMGANVLEACRVHGVERTLTIGSASGYPAAAPIPTAEQHLFSGPPPGDTAPYATAKLNLWVMGQAYARQYGMDVRHLVLTNVYGPGDHFETDRSHVVAALVRRVVERRDAAAGDVEVWGDGSASRDFLYVEDAARGIVDGLERLDTTEPVNLGSGVEVTIRTLAETLVEVSGFQGEIAWDPSKPAGAPRRGLDIARARQRIGFEPQVALREGLSRTVGWYEAHPVLG